MAVQGINKQTKREFIDWASELAMEQMVKYGVPASVTTAQACIESGYGSSFLFNKCNACFGVTVSDRYKDTVPWIIRNDEDGNHRVLKNRFRVYDTYEESFEGHSRTLQLDRYRKCFNHAPTDYRGWLQEIKAGGYAGDPNYVFSNCSVIESNGLSALDSKVVEVMARYGHKPGDKDIDSAVLNKIYSELGINPNRSAGKEIKHFPPGDVSAYVKGERTVPTVIRQPQYYNRVQTDSPSRSQHYSMPVAREEGQFIIMGDDMGYRPKHPVTGQPAQHNGIDISEKRVNGAKVHENVLATEDNGKVVHSGAYGNGGNTVIVEYERQTGEKYRVEYMHLSKTNVSVGDKVMAGDILGVTGNTGRSTGSHLHFGVKEYKDGAYKYIDPKVYLAEIQIRGNISTSLYKDGKDMLCPARQELLAHGVRPEMTANQDMARLTKDNSISDEEDWLKKLMGSGSSQGLSAGDDIMPNLLSMLLPLLLMGMVMDGKTKSEKMEATTHLVETGVADVTSLTPSAEHSEIRVSQSGNVVLNSVRGGQVYEHQLTPQEINALARASSMSQTDMVESQKNATTVFNSAVATEIASSAFEQRLSQGQDITLARTM